MRRARCMRPVAMARHRVACGSSGSAPASQRSSQSRRRPGTSEHRRQFAGQRPRLQRVVVAHVRIHRRQRGPRPHRRIGQRRVQAPVQAGGIEIVGGPAEVGIERTGHEFARREEVEVGRDAVFRRQRGLQPAPHRHLRDQHHVRLHQRPPRHRFAQFVGQQFRQHVQRIGVVEAEVGRGAAAHRRGIVPDGGRSVRDHAAARISPRPASRSAPAPRSSTGDEQRAAPAFVDAAALAATPSQAGGDQHRHHDQHADEDPVDPVGIHQRQFHRHPPRSSTASYARQASSASRAAIHSSLVGSTPTTTRLSPEEMIAACASFAP